MNEIAVPTGKPSHVRDFILRFVLPYTYAAITARARHLEPRPPSDSVTRYEVPPGGGDPFWASLWDLAVFAALFGGAIAKIWIESSQTKTALNVFQIVIVIVGLIPLFGCVRDRLPGGSVVYRLLWAIYFGYTGGSVSGDVKGSLS